MFHALTAIHFAAGHLEGAAAILEQWTRVEPLSLELRQYRRDLENATVVQGGKKLRFDGESPGIVPAPVGSPSLAVPATLSGARSS